MSLLGFDAVGRWALGQLPNGQQTITLTASAGSFSVSGVSAVFRVAEAATTGSLAVSGLTVSFATRWPAAAGAVLEAGVSAAFVIRETTVSATFSINGQPANEPISELAQGGSFAVAGVPAALVRTGDDYEFKLGGVGHFLEEIERQKQLNAITRKIPGPVDRRTIPRFEPLRGVPSAPAVPVPDMAAVQNQRMAEAARQAAVAKRRREEEALLLLAC